MDRSDSKASDFERRVSHRVSRAVSVQAAGGGADMAAETAADDLSTRDDESILRQALAMSVADGFRASVSSEGNNDTNNYTTNSSNNRVTRSSSLAIGSGSLRRRSTSRASRPSISNSISPEPEHLSLAPTTRHASDSVSSDASSSSSSSSSSHPISISVTPPENQSADQQTHSNQPSTVPTLGMAIRPSSISKPPVDPQSGSSTAGDSASSSASTRSVNHDAASGSTAVSGAAPAVQGEEPYQGPSGPSFPYQLYPQNVRLARSLSAATSSTAAPSESSYNGPRGPTFPYSLYPQNTMGGGPSTIQMNSIPVGFPGMSDNYRRRLGPDGEEIADMIGPDGHTEQLPPYSRYPDEAYSRKVAAAPTGAAGPVPLIGPVPESVAEAASGSATTAAAVVPGQPGPVQAPASTVPASARTSMLAAAVIPAAGAAAATAAARTSSLPPIPGAGGLGLASRNPEFDANDELDSPQSRHSSRSFTSEASRHEINSAAQDVNNEKSGRRARLQKVARKRCFFGIVPYWAICLVITALVLMGVILGAVIGTFLSRHKKPPKSHQTYASPAVTVTVDATPISTPADLPALPTGIYGMPLQQNKSPSTCFNDTTQAQAWSCNINYMSGMTVAIDNVASPHTLPEYNITIGCNESVSFLNGVIYYGEQAPVIASSVMSLVNDTVDLNRGPAWFRMLPYNKTVIVPETFLSATATGANGAVATSSSKTRRRRRGSSLNTDSLAGISLSNFRRKGVAEAGDKPWVCTWPDTFLEVFIYPMQNSSVYRISLSSTYTETTTMVTTSVASAALQNRYYHETSGMTVVEEEPATETTPTTTTTVLTTPATQAVSPTTQTPTRPSSSSSSVTTTTQDGVPTPSTTLLTDAAAPPPPYPRVIKVEERRMYDSRQATCVQYELQMVGSQVKASPFLDSYGNEIQITIAEEETGTEAGEKRDLHEPEELFRRDSDNLSDCGCLWWLT